MLSGVMMFDFMGWKEVGELIEAGIEQTIAQKRVTYDLERMMEGAKKVTTSEFATAIIENIQAQVVAK
jgi:isocitrate dehydrogenase